jgi:hypothetical protein
MSIKFHKECKISSWIKNIRIHQKKSNNNINIKQVLTNNSNKSHKNQYNNNNSLKIQYKSNI